MPPWDRPGEGVFVDRRGVSGLAFWAPILKSISGPCIAPSGERGAELPAKGDFSLRKVGPTEPEIGCYYQTLMAPDKG